MVWAFEFLDGFPCAGEGVKEAARSRTGDGVQLSNWEGRMHAFQLHSGRSRSLRFERTAINILAFSHASPSTNIRANDFHEVCYCTDGDSIIRQYDRRQQSVGGVKPRRVDPVKHTVLPKENPRLTYSLCPW